MEKEIYKLAGIRIPVFSPTRITVNLNQVLFVELWVDEHLFGRVSNKILLRPGTL